MSVLNEDQLLGAPGSNQYQIQRSLRFNSADSAYLSRTPASAGNRKTWTWSGWVKRSALGVTLEALFGNPMGSTDITYARLIFNNDCLQFGPYASWWRITTRVFRDTSSWYHIVLAFDTTQATAANRVKLYVNGVEETTFSTSTDPALNTDYAINNTAQHEIGRSSGNGLFNGYLADIHFIDGQALTPSSFGQTDATTGEWVPIQYTGTYGTNGFKLNFADNSAATAAALGKDTSPNGNNWTPNNLSVTAGAGNDSLVDTPTSYGTDTGVGGEVRGNYCTWNSLDKGSEVVATDGNLQITGGANYHIIRSTVGISSGKWYYELTVVAKGASDVDVGIAKGGAALTAYLGSDSNGWSYGTTGSKYNNGSGSAYGASFTAGDVISVAFDADAGTLTFYKNGTTQGQAFSGLTAGPYFFAVDARSGVTTAVNFGQRPFAYTAPSGFKALCDTNLAAPTIVKPSTVMDVVTYTGTGASLTPTSSLGFSPDLVWIKGRSGATDHALYDTVRGATADLVSNSTAAETTQAQGLTAFNSNGFTVGTLAKLNTNTATYAGWCWDAGSSTVTNTAGTITSQVRANASAGFSIVTYTGTGANGTVGHGLGVAPGLVIVKSRGANLVNWGVWHRDFAGTEYVLLSTTGAKTTDATMWNSTSPSSSVFSLGTNATVNQSTFNYVAYCFAPVAGYSAFGSYTGNGSADGPFVYCGFRPRWVMVKATSGATQWFIYDAARSPSNVGDGALYANGSSAENTGLPIDILSNGFKLRYADVGGWTNYSTWNYVWAAFAEFPFQYARAR